METGGGVPDAGRESVLALSLTDPGNGRELEVPLRFVRIGAQVYVLAPSSPTPQWLQMALRNPRIRWRIGGDTFEGTAVPITDPATIRATFESSFGADRVSNWFGNRVAGLALEPVGARPASYPDMVEAYFDRAAAAYDELVQANPLDRKLRTVSLGILRRSFHPGDHVLEIGCGTGLETLPLAAAGIEVTAVDVSKRMLERLRAKADVAGLAARIHTRHVRAGNPGILDEGGDPGRFQGAFSTFGALNCEPRWRDLPAVLRRLLAPGAEIVLGVWNRVCLFEMAAYAFSGHPRRAFARLRSPAPVGLTRFGIPVDPSSVGEYIRAFTPGFSVQAVYGLPVALPPYDLWPHMPNPETILPLLAALDERLRPRFPFNRLGDHFVLVLRRD